MKILFDTYGCPLANNGGSSTIVKSANTLVELGHEVTVIAGHGNQHTWTPLKAKYQIYLDLNDIPAAQAVIATGFVTAKHVVKLPNKCGRKFHWIRAWETWQIGEDSDIRESVLQMPTIKLVNGIQLKRKLKELGYESKVIYPGQDFDKLYPTNDRNNSNLVIGGLFRSGFHGQRKRTDWIFKTINALRKKGYKFSRWMFGNDILSNNGKLVLVDRYFRNPEISKKNGIYNMCDIWLAPTKSEGLHMPAAEAMLTECPVVGTEAPLSGMEDYLIHEKTGLVAKDNIESFINNTERLIKDKAFRLRLGEAGRVKILEMGDRKQNMQKFVKILEK